MTSQVIDLHTPEEANSTTYFTGTLFGTGKYENQSVYQWGKYEDTLVKSNGQWRINERTLTFMVWFFSSTRGVLYVNLKVAASAGW